MRIVKVLNNSLILALDDSGNETILMGKGIGYNKSIGYEFNKQEVEKVFVLKDKEVSRNIIRLASEVDSIYFEIAKNVIDYAKEKYDMELMDHIYLSLTDHISFAVKRHNDEIVVPNLYIDEMAKFNKREYDVGRYALKVINEQLGIELANDEIGNIAFHFINAQLNHPYNEKNLKIISITNDILDIVKYHFRIVYNEDSIAYSRYVTHVKFLAQRLVSNEQLSEDNFGFVYEEIVKKCVKEIECVKKIEEFIKEKYNYRFTEQESLYLTIHIHRILEECIKKEN